MSLYLKNPVLARCDNRNVLPKFNHISGSPEEWFQQPRLDQYNLQSISFDFFVNWQVKPEKLMRHAWIKVLLNQSPSTLLDHNGHLDCDLLLDLLNKHFQALAIDAWYEFCTYNSMQLEFIFIDDTISTVADADQLIFARVYKAQDVIKLAAKIITVTELKAKIKCGTGGDINVGRKGLTFGTTCLECFLSTSGAAYPGDADLVLFDKDTLNTVAVLEFKKHTLNTAMAEQCLSNYYPKSDRLKYHRLFLLNAYLTGQSKLVVLYYPTLNLEYSKVEIIGGTDTSLKVVDSTLIKLPVSAVEDTLYHYLKEFMSYFRGVNI